VIGGLAAIGLIGTKQGRSNNAIGPG